MKRIVIFKGKKIGLLSLYKNGKYEELRFRDIETGTITKSNSYPYFHMSDCEEIRNGFYILLSDFSDFELSLKVNKYIEHGFELYAMPSCEISMNILTNKMKWSHEEWFEKHLQTMYCQALTYNKIKSEVRHE